MYRVLTCLTTQHDYRLVILAVVVCAVGSFTAFVIYSHARQRPSSSNSGWLFAAGLCTGGTIWATHFIAMLAYEGGVPAAYAPALTIMSLGISFVLTTAGLKAASLGGRTKVAAGGAIIGLGIAAMHFTGMEALVVAGTKQWDPALVTAAIVAGMLLTTAAMLNFHEGQGIRAVATAAGFLTLGICTLHFTAMGAVTITPDLTISVAQSHLGGAAMAIAIAGITALVLGAGFMASIHVRRAAQKTALSTRELVDATMEAQILACSGTVVNANRRAAELWESAPEHLVGKAIFGDLLLDGVPTVRTDATFALRTRLKAAGGSVIPVEVVRQPLPAAERANEVYTVRYLRDSIATTDRLKRMNDELQSRERELRMQNMRFDTAMNNMTQGLCMFDAQHRVVVSNARFAELYGLSAEQMRPGTTLREVIERRIANGIYGGESPEAYLHERLSAIVKDLDMIQDLSDGRCMAISLRLMPEGGWVTTHEDVTERRRIEARLSHMAHHDALTDLPNRVLLRQKLEQALQGIKRGDPFLAVLMLDLDRFKEVNDTLGHLAGDALIKTIAERLREGMRQTATVSRFGGDEFAILESFSNRDDIEALPKRVQEIINRPFELEGHSVAVGTTIGIAVAPADGTDPDELLKKADLALYRAKSDARGTYRFFEPQMDVLLQERRALERDLRLALPAGQLELYYQPLVNLERDETSGYEALLRWHHPSRGPISPTVFIPLAEETGLITALGEWVLQQACAEAMRWPGDLKVAVNLSVMQFKSRNLMRMVIGVLATTQLPPRRLELEITESVMLNDAEGVFATLRNLHQLGVRIVLDDFGTGFSSLSYLLRFPFDKIKIDRSFIQGLSQEGPSLVLVRSLIQMGQGLNVDVTAEGVETQQQLDLLRAEGCTEVQGFYISPPRPADEVRQRQPHRDFVQRHAVA